MQVAEAALQRRQPLCLLGRAPQLQGAPRGPPSTARIGSDLPGFLAS